MRLILPCAFTFVSACGASPTPPPEVTPPTLSARIDPAIAYDETRQRTILFGGFSQPNVSTLIDNNDTWSWDGTTWTRLATSGPSARHGAAVAWDASRQKIVLYGGRSGAFPSEVVRTDTWEWDGTSWTPVATDGPSERVHLSMGYDRARQRTVLYGGFGFANGELRDIWEWNGSAWSQASVSAALNTIARGVAYDEKAGKLYFISVDAVSNVWRMDTWNGTAIAPAPGTPPYCMTTNVSLGPTRGGVLLTGWCDASAKIESWQYDGAAWTNLNVAMPQPDGRGEFAMAYDRARDRAVLFGGARVSDGLALGDTWEFNFTAWVQK